MAIEWTVKCGVAAVVLGCGLGFSVGPASAAVPGATYPDYSQVIVFGDSLSDNGNFFALSSVFLGSGFPPAPYFNGRFSDGPVAVEQLAARLGDPLVDYAYGGAGTGTRNEAVFRTFGNAAPAALLNTGMLSQFDAYQQSLGAMPQADPNALYVVWGGANDLRYSGFDPTLFPTFVGNLGFIVETLLAEGARNLLLPLLPDIGLTPEARESTFGSQISQATGFFNFLLASRYKSLMALFPSAHLTVVDLFDVHNRINADPTAYGLTNVTDRCFDDRTLPPTLCATPGSYMYFDNVHPTTAMHGLFADSLLAELAVPEPSTLLLVACAVVGLLAASQRRGSEAPVSRA